MSWRVVWTRPAEQDMQRIDRSAVRRIYQAVHRLAESGRGDVKRLRGLEREWRLRVGDWRVRFTYDADGHVLIVLRVTSRGSAYRD